MPAARARPISLSTAERRRLTKLAYSHKTPYQQVIRVRIVLDAARGDSNAQIARRHAITVDTRPPAVAELVVETAHADRNGSARVA